LYAAARGRPPDAHERLARRRTVAQGIERLRAADPAQYDRIALRLRRYDERLRRFGIHDRHLDWDVSTGAALRFAARESLIALVLLPLAAIAFVGFAAPYAVTRRAARPTTDPEMVATAKVASGFAIYAAWLAAIAGLAWAIGGRAAAAATLFGLPIVAAAGLFAIERETEVVDAVRAWWLLRRTREGTRDRLRRSRSDLADVLDEVHAWMQRHEPSGGGR
jgi:hypothetical protein